ncbi:uncharacterized protein LOC131889871 [Tigriopus californicus]|uniref:uncharacterized protein LOC131889871 n=1 Tax=Tigriopus californicus TaxID=6832 RepID=UPI0027DA0C1E|nr:uncharacterized protein LOC131889871 [Tigriopus californicus]
MSMEARRQSILDMACAGADKKAIAKLTGANITTVRRVINARLGSKDVSRKSRKPIKSKKRTKKFIRAVKTEIDKDPTKSMRKMAKKFGCDEKTIRTTVKDDLGMKSLTRPPRQLITERVRVLRLQRCQTILSWMKRQDLYQLR